MTFPKAPEQALELGFLDDAAFADNAAGDVWAERELVRNGNLLKARGGLVNRWLADAASADSSEAQGAALGVLWPFWHLATQLDHFPVPKKPGLTRLRVAMRATIEVGRDLELQVASAGNGVAGDLLANPPPGSTLVCAGSGARERYTGEFDVQTNAYELLSYYVRGLPDPDKDGLLDTGTYGGASSGTVSQMLWAAGVFWDNATTWNVTGSQVHLGGHYITFFAGADNRPVWGPAAVLNVLRDTASSGHGLFFWPTPPATVGLPISGLSYEIRECGHWRPTSLAAYAVDLEVTP